MMRNKPSQQTDSASKPVSRRGIKPGQVAWSETSQVLHKKTADITKAVVERWKLKDPNIRWQKKLSPAELIKISRLDIDPDKMSLAGVAPDGGIILYQDSKRGLIPLFSLEAKEQKNGGNAIERWYKNYTALKCVGPRMAFVTFCSGKGAGPDGVISRALNHALIDQANSYREPCPRSWNKLYGDGPSLFRRESGFTSRQIETVVEHLMSIKVSEVRRR